MATILKTMGFSVLLALIYLLAFFVVSNTPKASAQAAQPKQEASQTNDYTYTAQAGDTYSQMARKAIQTYGITQKVKLSQAEIVFAETKLTIEAGAPELNQGSSTTIKNDAVKKWVEAAQKLSDAQEARWATYVKYVDFNTNKVGQS